MKRKSMFQLSGLIRSGFLWPWRYTAFIVSNSSRPATPCSLSGVRFFQSALRSPAHASVKYEMLLTLRPDVEPTDDQWIRFRCLLGECGLEKPEPGSARWQEWVARREALRGLSARPFSNRAIAGRYQSAQELSEAGSDRDAKEHGFFSPPHRRHSRCAMFPC